MDQNGGGDERVRKRMWSCRLRKECARKRKQKSSSARWDVILKMELGKTVFHSQVLNVSLSSVESGYIPTSSMSFSQYGGTG